MFSIPRASRIYWAIRADLDAKIGPPWSNFIGLLVLRVGQHETGLGAGWSGGCAGSNNVGAIYRPCSKADSCRHTTSVKPNPPCFKTYQSIEAGGVDTARLLIKDGVMDRYQWCLNAQSFAALLASKGYHSDPQYYIGLRRADRKIVAACPACVITKDW